jgi:oligopeptidase B
MYWEPAKYVAKLRTLKTDQNPLVLKDRAFEVAWMLEQVGVTK